TWQDILYYPGPPVISYPSPNLDSDINSSVKSIAGLAQGIIETMESLKSAANLVEAGEFEDLIQTFFTSMESVDLTTIFGGG
ncbi:MAG: hypothetical protein KAT16_11675, partial [Candidatus Heimdallarchaeota archaeon]|nr:hypothetical protein [Candidatus Heimdallarchaeota archaeon]